MDTAVNSFANTNVGHGLDYDGYYGDQCVDLVNFWSRYLGKGSFAGPTALSLTAPAGWTWTANTPQGVPPAGAVVKANFTPAGHVFIALPGANTSTIPCIEQNWNGHMYVTRGSHDYTHVLGWWTVAQAPPTPTPVVTPGASSRTVPIKSAVNVRTQPNTSAPIAGALHVGYCVITGEQAGGSGTVGTHTSSTWYRTLNGNWFNAAATM